MYPKDAQLKKNRRENEKKLEKNALHNYKMDINFFANHTCQLCKKAQGQDHHHPYFGRQGADRDDRVLVLVCRSCHNECHKEKHGEWNTKAKQIGNENWRKHNGEVPLRKT